MKAIHPAILEAARLTRAGRLTEATALLQTALTGEAAHGPATARLSLPAGDPPSPRGQRQPDASGVAAAERSPPGRYAKFAMPAAQGFSLATREPPLPPGARFIAASHGCDAGSRDYKLFIPSGYAGQPLPLVVMLHGCTQTPDDFAAGTRMNALCEEHACFAVYPAQSAAANTSRCWNWFNPGDQGRDGEPSIVAGIVRQVMREHSVDSNRVYAAGLSAGGAAAAVLGAAYPDMFAAVGVHSGLACGAASDVPSAFAAMRGERAGASAECSGRPVPAIVFHGDKDATVHVRNGDEVLRQFLGSCETRLRAEVTQGSASGRSYGRTRYVDGEGDSILEIWIVAGAGHAWSGGDPRGSFTDPSGPDASREMLRFFLSHPKRRTAVNS